MHTTKKKKAKTVDGRVVRRKAAKLAAKPVSKRTVEEAMIINAEKSVAMQVYEAKNLASGRG